MRQLQVTVPQKSSDEVREILEDYSSDISGSDVEREDSDAKEFFVTVESDQIDDLTEEMKSMKELDLGDLSIRVIKQESLIKKGQETSGESSNLSQQEIYSKAQEFSGFDTADWGLVLVSGVVAAAGMSTGNLAVVIGAMMFAPLLSPLVAASVSITVGDRRLMKKSLQTTSAAVLINLGASMVASLIFTSTSDLLPIFTGGTPLTLILAALVGAAASMASATGRQDQVAGVAVSIALVPPLAAAGIQFGRLEILHGIEALTVAAANMLGIIVAGTGTFRALGLKPKTYYKQSEAKMMWRYTPLVVALMLIVAYVAVLL